MYISVKKYLYLVITALSLRSVTLFILFFSQYIFPFFLLPLGCPFYGYFFGYAVFSFCVAVLFFC